MTKTVSSSTSTPYYCLILLSAIPLFIFYSYLSFPQALKDVSPDYFDSHPIEDLSSSTFNIETLQNAKILKNDILTQCEDIQISSAMIIYCVTRKGDILAVSEANNETKILSSLNKPYTYGLRLSRDEKYLYFMNSELGLTQINLQTNAVSQLVWQYNGERLLSLNSIETHPQKPELIYFTQSMTLIPMSMYTIDIFLNRPYGRLFEFNKKTNKTLLIVDGFHFTNGLVFQKYKGQQTLLVAESNRFRLFRVYLSEQKRGIKQVAIDKLHIYLDNVKMNDKGQVWIAGPTPRDAVTYFADHNPWIRAFMIRLPTWLNLYLSNQSTIGGVRISFNHDNTKYVEQYFLWPSLPTFKFTTAIRENNNKLYLSSLQYEGILVIQKFEELQSLRNKTKIIWDNQNVGKNEDL